MERAVNESVTSAPPPRGGVTRVLRVVLAVVVVAFIGYALVDSWAAVREALQRIGLGAPSIAVVLMTASGLAQFVAWRFVLAAYGTPLPWSRELLATWVVSQVAKYVPGSVWPAVVQAQFARRHGIPTATIYTAFFAQLLCSLAAAGFLSALVLGAAVDAWIAVLAGGAVLGGIFLVLLILRQNLLTPVFSRVPFLSRRTLPRLEDARSIIIALAAVLASWILAGAGAWVLAVPLGAGAADLPFLVGANGFSWAVGLVIVILPAGLGAREGIVVVTYGLVVGAAGALTIAVLSRFLQIVVDLLLVLVFGWRVLRRRSHLPPPSERTSVPPAGDS